MKTDVEFTDAKALARKHPGTFSVPNQAKIDSLTPGDSVKVCINSERFWVLLTSVKGGLRGDVDNDLVNNDHLRCGAHVAVEPRHIYQIMRK